MRELLAVYLEFLKLGVMNFGGGYALMPLLSKELVEKKHWATEEELVDYYAVGQCTPGAFAVNVSTFIGIKRKGVLGGILATLGFITPAFFIIFIIASLLNSFSSNTYVINALAGIRVCVFSLVLYALSSIVKRSIKDIPAAIIAIGITISVIFIPVIPLYCYVILAAILGILISYIREKRKPRENDEVKPQKAKVDYRPMLKYYGITFLGFLVGLLFGIFGVISTVPIKHKGYRHGVYSSILLWFVLMTGICVLVFFHTPIIFTVYFQFFKIGICAFGGGLATIPFLNELGQTTGWFTQLDLANMIAVSESTPGAVGVNTSTYVGYTVLQVELGNSVLSFLGSMVSTIGLATPSVIVICIVAKFLDKFKTNKYVNWIFYGLRAASIGLICGALYSIVKVSLFRQYATLVDGTLQSENAFWYSIHASFQSVNTLGDFFTSFANFCNLLIDWKALAIATLFAIGLFKFKKHPIVYISIAAVLGILLQMNSITILT